MTRDELVERMRNAWLQSLAEDGKMAAVMTMTPEVATKAATAALTELERHAVVTVKLEARNGNEAA